MKKAHTNHRKISIKEESTEHRIELLKERIYATIALLAVLVSIDPDHTSPFHAILVIAGTALSLWGANVIAWGMSRRIILRKTTIAKEDIVRSISRYTPLLAEAVLPIFLIFLSMLHVISFRYAIYISIAESFLFMIVLSYLSAHKMHVGRFQTLLISVIAFSIGMLIVFLKLAVGH